MERQCLRKWCAWLQSRAISILLSDCYLRLEWFSSLPSTDSQGQRNPQYHMHGEMISKNSQKEKCHRSRFRKDQSTSLNACPSKQKAEQKFLPFRSTLYERLNRGSTVIQMLLVHVLVKQSETLGRQPRCSNSSHPIFALSLVVEFYFARVTTMSDEFLA